MELKIRCGADDDAEQAIDVIRRSIIELCESDHRNDSAEIAEWVRNKTEESWRKWVRSTKTALALYKRCGYFAIRDDSAGLVLEKTLSHY